MNIFKTLEDKYNFIKTDTSGASKENLCRILEVSRSAYYAWLERVKLGYESNRATKDKAISREILRLHQKYPTLGFDSLHRMLKPTLGATENAFINLKHGLVYALSVINLTKQQLTLTIITPYHPI